MLHFIKKTVYIESFRVKFVKKTMALDVNSLNFRENFPKIWALLMPIDRAAQSRTVMSLGEPVKLNKDFRPVNYGVFLQKRSTSPYFGNN